ncbi:MAG: hypothetical protein DRJ41_02005 [Thermoprotei archaeon]|nr:MAG: hypothetical protein DRJ41_02005 [Thermoprotei archaeon]HDI31686.1 alkaline phosphatase family protein [Thermofilum sp.]
MKVDSKHSILPRYEDYCISNLLNTIFLTFGIKPHRYVFPKEIRGKIKGAEKIVVFVVDGLSYNVFKSCNFSEDSFFRDAMLKEEYLYPVTTVFPSTTASALTTFHTGLTPQEHGIPEWCVYFEELDMLFEALPFKPAREEDRDRFLRAKLKPREIFGWETVYQKLKRKGIRSYTFIKRKYVGEGYAREALKGSEAIGYIGLSDLMVNLKKLLKKLKEPSYIWVYWNLLDSISHIYGPLAEEVRTELSLILYGFKNEIIKRLKKKLLKNTILVLTSDHGQTYIDPSNTVYISSFQKIRGNIKLGKNGKRILPGGSPRDLFLYIKESKVDDVMSFLLDKLEDKALIMKSEEAIRQGLFGRGSIRKGFKERIGEILILPLKNHLVWYRRRRGDDLKDPGYHGGLSREEMLVPLFIIELSSLHS